MVGEQGVQGRMRVVIMVRGGVERERRRERKKEREIIRFALPSLFQKFTIRKIWKAI